MKRLPLLLSLALLVCLPSVRAAERQVDANILPAGPGGIQTLWNTTPGRTYRLEATTNFSAPWLNALPGPGTLIATSNALSQTFATDALARFFRVLAVDTEGPEVYRTEPAAGGIAVSRSAVLRAWLRDDTGIATNTLALTLVNPTATNGPLTLADTRLSYTNGLLTYTPTNTETLGAAGDTVTVRLAVADTLGNQTTNFAWSFQLELPPVASTNLVFIGGGGGAVQSALRKAGLAPQSGPDLTLVSSNGNTFVFSYTGAASGVTNGMMLVNATLQSGYTVVVTNFTQYAVSNTVVVITRPAKLAELLKDGSLVSAGFTEITTNAVAPQAALALGLPLNYHHDLAQVVYSGGGLTVELLPGSAFDWQGQLDLGVNIRDFRLRDFEMLLNATVTANIQARAVFGGAVSRTGSQAVITPITKRFGTFIGVVPVWVDLVYELEVGYSASATATNTWTTGISGLKELLVGRRWSEAGGWSTPYDSPAPGYTFTLPAFQAEATAEVKVWLQPKVTVYLYSVAGVTGDLQPYLKLAGNAQANAGGASFDLSLYAGLTSTVGLNLKVWDDAWGEQPSHTFDLIPQSLLWHTNGSTLAPTITTPPQSVTLPLSQAATFSVEASGAGPLAFHWLRNGLYLSDDPRTSGSRATTLRVQNVRASDVASYQVEVGNSHGRTLSEPASLGIFFLGPDGGGTGVAPAGMALIPAGTFAMGNSASGSSNSELPVHTAFVSAFYMDKYAVTKALWDEVHGWAVTNGYSFDSGSGLGKGPTHPVQTVSWYDCVKWCNARSEKEGQMPAYYTDAGQTAVYRSGQVDVQNSFVKWTVGYRLPTEAEREKAARGGLSGQRFPWGNTISHGQATYQSLWIGGRPYWDYDVNSTQGLHRAYLVGGSPYTSPVGSFAANGYGLYDMAGNKWNWCWDWYGSYGSGAQSDPVGPSSGTARVFRGGSWESVSYDLRCAYRAYAPPVSRHNSIGFRCVLGQP